MSALPRRREGRGHFLSLEGVDGAGKSTQIRLLAAALRAAGHEVLTTREPGGSPGAEEIRRLLVEGEGRRWSAETEVLLFTAARRDHLERTILPALARGALVLSDRFADSTRVYQGLARPDLAAEIERLHAAFIAREPDLTVLIDMDPALALARGRARGGAEQRFEGRGAAFQTALRAGFLALAAAHPGRIRTIDGARPEGEVAADILALVGRALA
ncbi:MAG: dTMP kinase [Rhodobacteraceae bacterium]|nr:dTMP kinase [Paracoccaceae bacterium]